MSIALPMPPDSITAHQGYRPCVGIMLINSAGLVFVGRRRVESGPEHVDHAHAWQMPQGGVDKDEDPYLAALRELHEETNVQHVKLLAEAPAWYAYDLPKAISDKAWKGRWKGQTQKWFALQFLGHDDEIDILAPGGGKHRPEFDSWSWKPIDRLVDLIIPFKRHVYEKVVADFKTYAKPL